MRPRWWVLLGLLVIGLIPPSDAHERKVSHEAQAARFERLLKQHPNDPTLHYNLGTARYQQGHYDKAAESLSAAIASSGSSLQGRASYNLGNTRYRLGRAAEQTTPNQAVASYQQALEDYRLAIRQDPKDADAKYNYELAERRLKALKAQQQPAQSAGQSGESKRPQQEQQAQAAQPPQPGAQGSEHNAPQAAEPQSMSQQQALWILDTLKNEERGALVKEHQGPAQESDVEQDW